MEIKSKASLTKQNRFTIGFLDEDSYDEYHSNITAGVFEAAARYDLNVIRFGHFGSWSNIYKNNSYIDMALEHIQQYKLDGLMFLGWARLVTFKGSEYIKQHFGSIPLLSLGSKHEGIAGVYFAGASYIHEMLVHLIQVHGLKKIAFIAPFWPDPRCDVYIDTMKDYGIYNPNLYVAETELTDFDLTERGKKAVDILLDNRKVDCDAIVSLFNYETKAVIDELESRGFKVPGDIAVTSYEDGELGKFASPSFTTVYFPWKEIGYYGCEKMYELLTQGQIPEFTVVPGKIILRDSCGCVSGLVLDSGNSSKLETVLRTASRTVPETIGKQPTEISAFTLQMLQDEWRQKLNNTSLDLDILLKAFFNDYLHQSNTTFLAELESQFHKISDYRRFTEIEEIVTILRTLILPYMISQSQTILWAENLFQQTEVLVLETKEAIWTREKVRSEHLHLIIEDIGQILVTHFNFHDIMNSLALNLSRVGIPGCYIFLFKDKPDQANLYDEYELVFQYMKGAWVKPATNGPQTGANMTPSQLFEILFSENRPYFMMTHLLHVAHEYIGFIIFETGPMDESVYRILSLNISSALNDAILLEKLGNSYKRLVEQAHQEGMAEIITGILHNVGNILNSINVSTHFVKDLIHSSPLEKFSQANQLIQNNLHHLKDFLTNDPKGKKLIQYYIQLGEPVQELQMRLLEHINRLEDKTKLITDIIMTQQGYIGAKSTLEEIDIVALIEDVLKMNLASLEKYNIEICRNYQAISKIKVQKTKLFYVLVNLIKNAQDAMLEVPQTRRRLTLCVEQSGNDKFIRVTDTGHGIPANFLHTIFAYGFTTKKGGHGFGLHSCANYLMEMEGRIWAESAGAGKGATFVLQFK
jgi:signal transduction histidine kinase/DNA-binding LacI/PurR family transcriptional regulator